MAGHKRDSLFQYLCELVWTILEHGVGQFIFL